MITLVKISKPELIKVVAISYEGDQELFDKYHIGKMDFKSCVFSTMEMIRDAALEKELRYYKVVYQKKPVGYIVEFDNFLYSFGLNIKFRKKDILAAWWIEIKKIMGGKFITMLYENNLRAIKHLERQGFVAMPVDKENHSVTLIYNSSHHNLKIA